MAGKKNQPPVKCHGCNQLMAHTPGQDLHHGSECEQQRAKKLQAIERSLRRRGFTIHPKVPNAYVKHGIAITIEQIHHEGIDKTLQKHEAARAAAGTPPAQRSRAGAGAAPGPRRQR